MPSLTRRRTRTGMEGHTDLTQVCLFYLSTHRSTVLSFLRTVDRIRSHSMIRHPFVCKCFPFIFKTNKRNGILLRPSVGGFLKAFLPNRYIGRWRWVVLPLLCAIIAEVGEKLGTDLLPAKKRKGRTDHNSSNYFLMLFSTHSLAAVGLSLSLEIFCIVWSLRTMFQDIFFWFW